jgi:hypothetical protein
MQTRGHGVSKTYQHISCHDVWVIVYKWIPQLNGRPEMHLACLKNAQRI